MAITRPDDGRRQRRGAVVLLLVVLLALGLVLALRAYFTTTEPPRVLRLAGSGTIGEILMPKLVESFLRSKGATGTSSETGPQLTAVTATLPGSAAPIRVEIATAGTDTAFAGLGDGSVDLGMASRKITDDERTRLAGRGNLIAPGSEHVLALDALAVIVHPGRQLPEISQEQLARVYRCELTDWAQLGGTPGPIRALALAPGSGTMTTLSTGALGGGAVCGQLEVADRVEELAQAVATDPAALGVVGLGFVTPGVRAVPLRAGQGAPFTANPDTISTESYPLTRRLYLYQPTLPAPDPLVTELVDFALGAGGQQIVTETGFVSSLYTPPPSPPSTCAQPLPAYCALVGGAERVLFDVRFAPGSDLLDNRASPFLDLFAQQLTEPGHPSEVILAGFADNAGSIPQNLALSEARARRVAEELVRRGVTVPVRNAGFGQDLPVAANDTAPGREQNRRVEVWQR